MCKYTFTEAESLLSFCRAVVDAVQQACVQSTDGSVHEAPTNSMVEQLAGTLRRLVFSRFEAVPQSPVPKLDRGGFEELCWCCDQESNNSLEFLQLVMLRAAHKVNILELVGVEFLELDGTVYGQGIQTAEDILECLLSSFCILMLRLDFLINCVPIRYIESTSTNKQVINSAEAWVQFC